MDAARWARIERIAEAAMACDAAEREAYLDSACGEDQVLREEISELLSELGDEPDFLERSPVAPIMPPTEPAPAPHQSFSIGRYHTLRLLGQGGMGEVYLAEADDGSRVALKLARAGVQPDQFVRRFELEHRVLGSMQHRNIARMLDLIAADDGRPCVVLEYVEGLTLTTHADVARLGIRERLDLFRSVAEAVEYAHRHLVVHRDLKPANILVDADGTPKLLDFGIAKVLEESAMGPVIDTATSDRLLTLDYAAPEQLRGDAITTATDVHALGVLLHELLTGIHPFRFDGATPGQIEHAIEQTIPELPSRRVRVDPSSGPVATSDAQLRAQLRGASGPDAHARRLAGDLDNIILKAVRKEPERRYASVAALREDIERHLAGHPVRARPDTLGYRARRFVRRNAGSVAVATLVMIGILLTTAMALVQSHRAEVNATLARTERDQAVAERGFLMEMFGATDAGAAVGSSETLRELLARQSGRIDATHSENPLLAARLHAVVADAWERLGEPDEAIAPARRSLALRVATLGSTHPDVAAAENLLGWVLHQAGDQTEAEVHLQEALRLRRTGTPIDSAGLARTLNDLGVLYNSSARYAEAESVLVEALDIRRGAAPIDSAPRMGIGITANNLAAAYYYQARYDDAARIQGIAVAALDTVLGPNHQRSVIALANLAAFRLMAGDNAGATTEYRGLLARQTALQGEDHPATLRVMTSLATSLAATDNGPGRARALVEADSLLVRALTIQEVHPGLGAPQLGVTLDRLAMVRDMRGDTEAALATARRAVQVLTDAHGAAHQETAAAEVRLGLLLAKSGERRESLVRARRGVQWIEASLGADHPTTARAKGRLCRTLRLVGTDRAETEATCDAAIIALRKAPASYARDLAETMDGSS